MGEALFAIVDLLLVCFIVYQQVVTAKKQRAQQITINKMKTRIMINDAYIASIVQALEHKDIASNAALAENARLVVDSSGPDSYLHNFK